MKKVLLMTGLLIGMGLCTMAQTTPSANKKEIRKETPHHKSDSTSHKVSHEKKGGSKTNKKQ